MFQYYFLLGLRSLRRNPALTALMVLTLAIGVAASVSTLTILHVMSGNPIPHKSDRLFVPQFDNGPIESYKVGDKPNDEQMSYRDAVNLMTSKAGERRTALFGEALALEPERKDMAVFIVRGIATSSDYFNMFEAPFLRGQAWAPDADKRGDDVAIISRALSGKTVRRGGPYRPAGTHGRLRLPDRRRTQYLEPGAALSAAEPERRGLQRRG